MKDNMGLEIDIWKCILGFTQPIQDTLSLANTCTTFRNAMIFPALCHIIENDHNYTPECNDLDLTGSFHKLEWATSRLSREVPFSISPSSRSSTTGKFYTINVPEYKAMSAGGFLFQTLGVTHDILAFVGKNGICRIYRGELKGTTHLMICDTYRKIKITDDKKHKRPNPIMDFLLDTPCYKLAEDELLPAPYTRGPVIENARW